jgi:hypothetical protein
MFIGRLAHLTGCTPKAIRPYEQMGLINPPQRSGRYRVYTICGEQACPALGGEAAPIQAAR